MAFSVVGSSLPGPGARLDGEQEWVGSSEDELQSSGSECSLLGEGEQREGEREDGVCEQRGRQRMTPSQPRGYLLAWGEVCCSGLAGCCAHLLNGGSSAPLPGAGAGLVVAAERGVLLVLRACEGREGGTSL